MCLFTVTPHSKYGLLALILPLPQVPLGMDFTLRPDDFTHGSGRVNNYCVLSSLIQFPRTKVINILLTSFSWSYHNCKLWHLVFSISFHGPCCAWQYGHKCYWSVKNVEFGSQTWLVRGPVAITIITKLANEL